MPIHLSISSHLDSPITVTIRPPYTVGITSSNPSEVYGIWTDYTFHDGVTSTTITLMDYSQKAWENFTYLWGSHR